MADSLNKRYSCVRCGACCSWFVIANERSLKDPAQKEYMEQRADAKANGFYLVHAPCRHLIDGTKEDPRTTCDIYKTRPLLCREYKGKPSFKNHKFAVPPGCAMAYVDKSSGNTDE